MSDDSREVLDRRYVAAAAAGSREAFDELVRRHQARIYNLARALVGNAEDAEDLAQDVFVRAYRAIGTFRGDSSFRTWLYQVALNVIRTHLTKRARYRRLWFQPAADDSGEDRADRLASGEDVEASLVRRQAIDRALGTLSPELRMAVTLRDVEGLGYREIAEVLNIPIGTVESRIFRGRQRLRAALEPLVGRPEPEGAATPDGPATPRLAETE